MITILQSSESIRRALAKLMLPGTRRVAITAFVGDGARGFIPKPEGVEIICWPKAGGTNPLELRRLIKSGARVRFSDSLHMKVYWASGRGVIVTSANLSTNALGAGGLKEFGVLMPSSYVHIDEILASIKPRPTTQGEMKKLDAFHRAFKVQLGQRRNRADRVQFEEWYSHPFRDMAWRFHCWEERCDFSKNARARAQAHYGKLPYKSIGHGGKSDYPKGSWVLSFRRSGKKGARKPEPEWLWIDFTVRVGRKDTHFKDTPYESVQVDSDKSYPRPPFELTRRFKEVFREASDGMEEFKLKPRRKFLDKIYRLMTKRRRTP